MGLLSALARTAFDVVTSPIEAVKDVATLGGLITDEREPYTVKRLKEIGDDLGDVRQSLDD